MASLFWPTLDGPGGKRALHSAVSQDAPLIVTMVDNGNAEAALHYATLYAELNPYNDEACRKLMSLQPTWETGLRRCAVTGGTSANQGRFRRPSRGVGSRSRQSHSKQKTTRPRITNSNPSISPPTTRPPADFRSRRIVATLRADYIVEGAFRSGNDTICLRLVNALRDTVVTTFTLHNGRK